MTRPSRHRRTIGGVAVSACAALALGALVPGPAAARWSFHNDAVGERIVAPLGGTRSETCSGQLRASAGYGHFIDVAGGEDPAAFELPPSATSTVSYRVWKAPAGFTSFSGAFDDGNGVTFLDAEGDPHPATLVGSATTPRRKPLARPVPALGNPNRSDNYLFATAPLNVRLRNVAPGDLLGLAPTGSSGGIFVTVRAMDCRLKVLAPSVDLVPGSKANRVHLDELTRLVPVRIYGSANLKVNRITRVRLGEAPAAWVPAALRPSLRPRDVNGDGRLDRLYYFRQGHTDMQCIDRAVKVTGWTSDRLRFQRSQTITPVGCDG